MYYARFCLYIKWELTSMCFVSKWYAAFLLKFIALELSLNTIYSSCLTPSSRRNLFIHSISLATSVVAMASAFLPPPLWPGRGREG